MMEPNTNMPPGIPLPDEKNDYHGHADYGKVFMWLLALLIISLIVGFWFSPLLGVLSIFLLAVVKAGLVVANFMHLKFEPRLLWLVLGIVAFIFLAFYFGVFPDITLIQPEVVK